MLNMNVGYTCCQVLHLLVKLWYENNVQDITLTGNENDQAQTF